MIFRIRISIFDFIYGSMVSEFGNEIDTSCEHIWKESGRMAIIIELDANLRGANNYDISHTFVF